MEARLQTADSSGLDCKPELLSLDHTLGAALPLKLLVQGIKGLSPALGQPGRLIGAEEGPLSVMDGLPCSVIEDTEHGYNAIGVAIGPPDVAARGPDVVHGQPNATRTLGDASTLFQRVIDALQQHKSLLLTHAVPDTAKIMGSLSTHLYAVALHANEEAGGQLRPGCTSVEEGGGSVCEPSLAEQVERSPHEGTMLTRGPPRQGNHPNKPIILTGQGQHRHPFGTA
ncbi:MAG: hypothetical protein FRX49_10816 [Trebouxia sp. A1-2]|nr:MAG: hypothetical protein FRX49_10816 [Trebouxia sp. A1-2]